MSLSSERIHALDAVRGGALLLGIVLHAAMSFFPGPQIWLIADTQRSELAGAFFYIPHIFRMTLFFMLAGYFGRMAFHKKGAGGFIKNRLSRIVVPFSIFWPICFTAFVSLAIWGFIVSNGGEVPADAPPTPPLSIHNVPLTHLWFLYVLIIFYIGMLVLRLPIALVDRGSALRNGVDGVITILSRFALLPLILALPITDILYNKPDWMIWFGIPTPDYGLIPNTPSLVGYGVAFTFGWWAHRSTTFLPHLRLWGPAYLLVAIVLTIGLVRHVGLNPSFQMLEPGREKLLYAFAYGVACWTWTLGLTGTALRLLSGESYWRRYLADASYWMYIVHLPIVVALQILISPYEWPALAKYGLVLSATILITLVTYHFLVRYSFIGRMLNGKRERLVR